MEQFYVPSSLLPTAFQKNFSRPFHQPGKQQQPSISGVFNVATMRMGFSPIYLGTSPGSSRTTSVLKVSQNELECRLSCTGITRSVEEPTGSRAPRTIVRMWTQVSMSTPRKSAYMASPRCFGDEEDKRERILGLRGDTRRQQGCWSSPSGSKRQSSQIQRHPAIPSTTQSPGANRLTLNHSET